MAVSQVKIINYALERIKKSSIISRTEDSTAARKANLIYDEVFDEMLVEFDWAFATERANLAQLSETPAWGYDYYYALPTNPYCLKVLEVRYSPEYRIEGRKLLTNETSVSIRYIKRVTNINELPPMFIKALYTRLAMDMCYGLTKSSQLFDQISKEYKYYLMQAKVNDANSDNPTIPTQGSWIDVRGNRWQS